MQKSLVTLSNKETQRAVLVEFWRDGKMVRTETLPPRTERDYWVSREETVHIRPEEI
jgi:hypothetical protein